MCTSHYQLFYMIVLISFPRQIGSQIYVLKDALIWRARYNACIINIVIDTADKVSAQVG